MQLGDSTVRPLRHVTHESVESQLTHGVTLVSRQRLAAARPARCTHGTNHASAAACGMLCTLGTVLPKSKKSMSRRPQQTRRSQAAQQWPRPTAAELEALSHEQTLALNATPSKDLNLNLAQRLGGLIDHWKAWRWSQEHWIQNFGHLKFRLRPCTSLHHYGYAGPAERFVSLEEYLTSDTFNRKFVLFENDFDAERLEILDGFAVPELLAGIHGAPIFSVGRKDTGVGFHRHSAAWLAQLQGRKLWLLVPGLLGGLNKLTGYDSLSSPFGDCKDLWSIHGPEEVQGNGLPFQNCQNDWQTWIFFYIFLRMVVIHLHRDVHIVYIIYIYIIK